MYSNSSAVEKSFYYLSKSNSSSTNEESCHNLSKSLNRSAIEHSLQNLTVVVQIESCSASVKV